MTYQSQEGREIQSPAIVAIDPEGDGFAIDFESDEPLVCKIDGSKPIEGCEACQ